MYTFSRIQRSAWSNLVLFFFFSLSSHLLRSHLVAAAAFGNSTNTYRARYTFFVPPYYVTWLFIQVRPPSVRSSILSSLSSQFCLLIIHCLQRICNSILPRASWMHWDSATRAAAWAFAHRVFKTLVNRDESTMCLFDCRECGGRWVVGKWRGRMEGVHQTALSSNKSFRQT